VRSPSESEPASADATLDAELARVAAQVLRGVGSLREQLRALRADLEDLAAVAAVPEPAAPPAARDLIADLDAAARRLRERVPAHRDDG
jgi:hypothetical protein